MLLNGSMHMLRTTDIQGKPVLSLTLTLTLTPTLTLTLSLTLTLTLTLTFHPHPHQASPCCTMTRSSSPLSRRRGEP